MCTSLAKQEHDAHPSTALSKDTAVFSIVVLPIVSKSNVTQCSVTWCFSAALAENTDRLTKRKLEARLSVCHPGVAASKLATKGA